MPVKLVNDIFDMARGEVSYATVATTNNYKCGETSREIIANLEKSLRECKEEKSITIKKYEILSPNKVIRVTFSDCTQEKVVCCEEDKFDLRRGLFIAISKRLYKDTYTLEGIEVKATELSYLKKYDSMVNKAIKEHNKLEKEIEEKIKRKKEFEKLEHEKRMNRDKKNRENKIRIQKEAYLKAMLEFNNLKGE